LQPLTNSVDLTESAGTISKEFLKGASIHNTSFPKAAGNFMKVSTKNWLLGNP
jgi:hypothetical protein